MMKPRASSRARAHLPPALLAISVAHTEKEMPGTPHRMREDEAPHVCEALSRSSMGVVPPRYTAGRAVARSPGSPC